MPRYLVEVSYKGTSYAGFQIQQNANSIQAEVEKALNIFFHSTFELTGSSRTDAGVHALQNFFHFDTPNLLAIKERQEVRSLNAILPPDIVIHSITRVANDFHGRFHAKSRSYQYHIYQQKNPFLEDRAFFYPYPLDINILQQAAQEVLVHTHFAAFSKKHTQVKTFQCTIVESRWEQQSAQNFVYHVVANRFLRGMVKGLVGTMLQVARKKISLEQFKSILQSDDNRQVDFSVPSHGLFLTHVKF